jgi:hypothetical protein
MAAHWTYRKRHGEGRRWCGHDTSRHGVHVGRRPQEEPKARDQTRAVLLRMCCCAGTPASSRWLTALPRTSPAGSGGTEGMQRLDALVAQMAWNSDAAPDCTRPERARAMGRQRMIEPIVIHHLSAMWRGSTRDRETAIPSRTGHGRLLVRAAGTVQHIGGTLSRNEEVRSTGGYHGKGDVWLVDVARRLHRRQE